MRGTRNDHEDNAVPSVSESSTPPDGGRRAMLSREFDGKSRERIIETPTVPTPVIWAATVRARAARDRDSNGREVEAAGEQYPWSMPQAAACLCG
jgi:hypothetical protein